MLHFVVLILTFAAPFLCLDVFKQSECGHSKSCLRWSSCNLPYCDFGLSWRPIQFNNTDYLELEIVGRMENSTNGFVALGFSIDNKMLDNGVVACRMTNGELDISCGHNSPHNNQLFSSNEIDPNFLVKSKGTLYGIEFDSTNNALRCRFLRLMTPTLMASQLKNLGDESNYYILSAKGISSTETRLSYHSKNRRQSPSSYSLTSRSWINAIITDNYRLIKVHACFMILGWIIFATNGIFIAFFYKNIWPKSSICGEKVWFQFHRLLQTSCIVCVVIGFIVIFVYVGRYSTLVSLPDSAHPVLGIIATSLLLVNPILALFRCNPEAHSRWIFNVVHFVVGISAYMCALCAMAIGIQLPPAGPYLPTMTIPYTIVIIFILVISIIFCAATFRDYIRNKIGSNPMNQFEEVKINGTQSTNAQCIMKGYYSIIINVMWISATFAVALIVLVLMY